jgi:multidrug resistance protein, MATE family
MNGVRFRKDIAPIALPIFLGMLVFQVQTLTNRAFLGRLNVEFLSVMSNVVFPMWTTMAMLNALATGATILVSQALGAGNLSRARALAAAALKWNSIVALALFVFWLTGSALVFRLMGLSGSLLDACTCYGRIASFSFLVTGLSSALSAIFQASGNTRPIMYAGALRSGLNILVDWLLIFGSLGFPRLSFLGAAVATVVSDLAGVLLLSVLLLRARALPGRPNRASILSAPLSTYGDVVRMGFPTSFEELLWNVGNLFLIRFLNMLDPLATAVYSLVFTIEILPIVVFMSLGQTTTVLVGKARGAMDFRRARGAALTAQTAAWVASAVLVVVFATVPTELVGIFTGDPSIIARAAPILLVSCFTFFPRSANFMTGSAIRGLGNTRWMLGTQLFGTVFLVCLGGILIFSARLGVLGLFIAMLADEAIRAAANTARFFTSVRARESSAEALSRAA